MNRFGKAMLALAVLAALSILLPFQNCGEQPISVQEIEGQQANPSIQVSQINVTEGMAGNFSFNLPRAYTADISIRWDVIQDESGKDPAQDFIQKSGIVTIPAGSLGFVVILTTTADSLYEGDEDFTVKFEEVTSVLNKTLSNAHVKILDDDPMPEITVNDIPNLTEGSSRGIQVSLSEISGLPVTLDYELVDGTAMMANADFSQLQGSITIPPMTQSQTIIVSSNQDVLDEDNENFAMQIFNVQGASVFKDVGVITILDDDAEPSISINDLTVNEGVQAGFAVTLSSVSSKTISFDWQTMDVTALTGSDYTTASGTVTIPAGSQTATISVDILADNVSESAETFKVVLSNAVNGSLADPDGIATVIDLTPIPQLTINDVQAIEGQFATFTVTASQLSAQGIMFQWQTVDVDAISGEDYVSASGTATIAPTNTSVVIQVKTNGDLEGDSKDEPNETFKVIISAAQGAQILDAEGIATILDDDAPPLLTLSSSPAIEGATADVVATLSTPSGYPVSFAWDVLDETAQAGSDFMITAGRFETIQAGQSSITLQIPTLTDGVFEGVETFLVSLSQVSQATLSVPIKQVTILDFDTAPVLTITSLTAMEGNDVVFTASLDKVSSQDVTFAWQTSDLVIPEAIRGLDYVASSGYVTISAFSMSQNFSVPTIDDALSELALERFAVQVTSLIGATLFDPNIIGTIQDNEPPPPGPSIEFASATSSVSEKNGNGNFNIEVRLSAASATPVSVAYAAVGGTATTGVDFDLAPGTLSFAPGEVSKMIVLHVNNDPNAEGDETIQIDLSSPSGGTLGAVWSTTHTIIDDDSATPNVLPIIEFDLSSSQVNAGNLTSINISISGNLTSSVSVNVSKIGGTAPGGASQIITTNPLTFDPGGTKTLSIDIQANDDNHLDDGETAIFELTGGPDVQIGTNNQHTLIIHN